MYHRGDYVRLHSNKIVRIVGFDGEGYRVMPVEPHSNIDEPYSVNEADVYRKVRQVTIWENYD